MMLPKFYKFGRFEVDTLEDRLFEDGVEVKIYKKAFKLLLVLIANNGHLVKTQKLLDEVWGKENLNVTPANIRSQVFNLRQIIEKNPDGPRYLTTKRGVGVKFFASDLTEPRKLSAATITKRVAVKTAEAAAPSMAVMPFRFRNTTVQYETFANTLAYAITLKLSQNTFYRVSDISDVLQHYLIDQDPIHIGRKLGVQYVVEGMFEADERSNLFIVRLIEVHRGAVLLEKTLEKRSLDIFSHPDVICDQVAAVIAAALEVKSDVAPVILNADAAEVRQAYDDGRSCWTKRTADNLWKAIEHFNRAITLDSRYAPAFAGLADCYNLLSYYSGLRPNEVFPKALEFAQRAIEINEGLAEPHASRAYAISRSQWQWEEAEDEYQRSIELDDSYATSHQWYAEHLTAMRRFDEARAEIQKARALDPESPIISTAVGTVAYFSGDYDKAIEQYLETIKRHPRFARVRLRLARAYAQTGRFKEAIRECHRGLNSSTAKETEIVQLGQVYAMAGMKKEAHQVLAKVTELTQKVYVSEYNLAIINSFLGNEEAAAGWLDQAWWSRDPWLEHLIVDPRLDGLRHHAKFRQVVRSLRLDGDPTR